MQDAFKNTLRKVTEFTREYGLRVALIVVALAFIREFSQENYKAALTDSVYKLNSINERGSGTAFLLNTEQGPKLVSNHHVCAIAQGGFMFAESDKGQELVKVLAADFDNDLCLLSPTQSGQALDLANKPPVAQESIYIAGHPLGKPFRFIQAIYYGESVAAIGIQRPATGCPAGTEEVNALFFSFCIKLQQLGQVSGPIYPGNSGSPVVNRSGDVVGVINSGDSEMREGGFVPLREVKAFIRRSLGN